MKRNLLLLPFLLFCILTKAQNGLECVVVEKYYVSDANDSIGNDLVSLNPGTLPVGSVTYRVYADMLQGYKFEGVYGVPGHELRLETSTLFFNNEDRGATTPNAINNNFMSNNSVMLDSWLSVGAASSTKYGVMKSADDGIANVVNIDSMLHNNDASAGIPLTVQDGLISGTPAPELVTFVGFSTAELNVFDAETVGNLVSTWNATWASLNGSKGPDTVANKVLIGQFTTNGTFSFKLNLQIGTPSGGTQNFVADSAVGSEIMLPCLTFNSFSVGISNPVSPAPEFSVYPNPATGMIAIAVNSHNEKSFTLGYKIIDVTGKIVLSKEIGMVSERYMDHVDISALHSGIYFIEVSQDGVPSHKKIIKN